MTTKYFLTFLAGATVAFGFQSAIAGQDVPPYYDEDTDTVIYNFVGSPVVSDRSRVPVRVSHGISPYYDEETDTVVYSFVGHQPRQTTAMADTP